MQSKPSFMLFITSNQQRIFSVYPVQTYPKSLSNSNGLYWEANIDVLISEAKELGYDRDKMLWSTELLNTYHHLLSVEINIL